MDILTSQGWVDPPGLSLVEHGPYQCWNLIFPPGIWWKNMQDQGWAQERHSSKQGCTRTLSAEGHPNTHSRDAALGPMDIPWLHLVTDGEFVASP